MNNVCLRPCTAREPLDSLFAQLIHAVHSQVPLIALQFSANNVYLSLAPSPPIGQQPNHLTAFVCGGAAGDLLPTNASFINVTSNAGVTAKMMTMPLDTVKKHLQVVFF